MRSTGRLINSTLRETRMHRIAPRHRTPIVVLHHPDQCVWLVKHRLPGRVRLYGDALRGDVRLARGICSTLLKQPGITHVAASPSSGTVLLAFDEDQHTVDTLVA